MYNICTLVGVGVLSLVLSSSGVLAGGGFGKTCTDFILTNDTMTANCLDESNGFIDSSLNLNNCITNDQGTLFCQSDGGFGLSCDNCHITNDTVMGCHCRGTPLGSEQTIDLNRCVENKNGILTCACC